MHTARPIMLKAEERGNHARRQLVARIAAERPKYLKGFHIGFDHWYSTESPENTELSQDIYQRLKKAGLIYIKPVEQFYDPVKGMFLADRYIKGECPNCHAKDQYADACEVCSIVNSPSRSHQSVLDAVRRKAGAEDVRPFFLQALRSEVRRIPDGMAGDAGRGCNRKWSTRRASG